MNICQPSVRIPSLEGEIFYNYTPYSEYVKKYFAKIAVDICRNLWDNAQKALKTAPEEAEILTLNVAVNICVICPGTDELAEAVANWISLIFNNSFKLCVLSKTFSPAQEDADIQKGHFSILCATPENVSSTDIVGYAGQCLAATRANSPDGQSHAVFILFGVSRDALHSSLREFTRLEFNRKSMQSLIEQIHSFLNDLYRRGLSEHRKTDHRSIPRSPFPALERILGVFDDEIYGYNYVDEVIHGILTPPENASADETQRFAEIEKSIAVTKPDMPQNPETHSPKISQIWNAVKNDPALDASQIQRWLNLPAEQPDQLQDKQPDKFPDEKTDQCRGQPA